MLLRAPEKWTEPYGFQFQTSIDLEAVSWVTRGKALNFCESSLLCDIPGLYNVPERELISVLQGEKSDSKCGQPE